MRTLFLSLGLLLSFCLYGQGLKQSPVGTFTGVTVVSQTPGVSYTARGNFISFQSYLATSVQVNDEYIVEYALTTPKKAIRFRITAISVVSGNRLDLTMIPLDGASIAAFPTGTATVSRPSTFAKLQNVDAAAPLAVQWATVNNNNIRIDSLLQEGSSSDYNGNRAITGSLLTGQNMGTTTDVQAFLDAVFFPSQNPTATLTSTYLGNTTTNHTIELMEAGAALPVTLNWTAGRLASTQPLASTSVNSTSVTANPAAGASTSGTLAATVTRNVNTSIGMLVTTTDSKTASASTTFTFSPKRYWGTNVGAPSSAQIVAGTNEFSSTRVKGAWTIPVGGTPSNVFYAYPTSFGALSSIIISGLESIGAFTQTTVSVTNASGYTQNYYVYTSNNLFQSTTISFNSVN